MIGFVYRWHDLDTDMYYIGSHLGTPDDGYVGSGLYFQRAYKKRPNSFKRSIIYIGRNFRQMEEWLLSNVDAANNVNYYNLKNTSIGGDTRSGSKNSPQHNKKVSLKNKGKQLSEEQKEKISKSLTGKKASKQTRDKMSKKRKGHLNPFYGKSHTKETKATISHLNKGKKNPIESMQKTWESNKKKVYCGELDITFESISECSKKLGLSPSTISNMIANRVKNRYKINKIKP